MSAIREALERFRKEIIHEARKELEELRLRADESVLKSIGRLNALVGSWQAAAERLEGFGLASIADISLAGGFVWTLETKPGPWEGPVGLDTVLEDVIRAIRSQVRPYLRWESDKTYEVFILLVPKKGKAA